MDDIAIRTLGLSKRYGAFTAVDALDLEVRFGEVFGLLGPNGAGKTTTILMLLGLTERTEGTAEVMGLDPARRPLEVKRLVGYLPDEVGFYGGLTGRQNLRFTARLNRLERATTERRIVILDEPTAAIDPVGVVELLAVIRSLAVELGVAVLLSSHLLPQVERVCDRVGIFVRGRMVEQGTVRELAERMPAREVLTEVGADGDPEATRAALEALPGVTIREQNRLDPRVWLVATDQDARREMVAQLTARGLAVFQVNRVGIELDELYRRYFAQAEEEAARVSVA